MDALDEKIKQNIDARNNAITGLSQDVFLLEIYYRRSLN